MTTQTTSRFDKDPDAVLDYKVDWSDWLAEGETIATSSWTVSDGITKDSDSADGTSATIWLSGGTVGRYTATNHVVTSQGREDDRTITLNVRER